MTRPFQLPYYLFTREIVNPIIIQTPITDASINAINNVQELQLRIKENYKKEKYQYSIWK